MTRPGATVFLAAVFACCIPLGVSAQDGEVAPAQEEQASPQDGGADAMEAGEAQEVDPVEPAREPAQQAAPEVPPAPMRSVAPPPLTAPGPAGPSILELSVYPLLREAENDLATGRTAYAAARTQIVSEVLPPHSPLRIRADGLGLLARQRTRPSAPRPDPDVVLTPLVAHAEADLRARQPSMALGRLTLVLERLPATSRLRARALRLYRSAARFVPGAPPPPPAATEDATGTADAPREDPSLRNVGEIVELYITAGLFGALTGGYLPLVISGDTASETTYGLTIVGGAGVFVVALLTLDLATTIPTGVPPTISAGIRLGMIHGALAMGLDIADGGTDAELGLTWVFSGAALGLAGGLALGFGLNPSTSDARFVESVALYGGTLATAVGMLTGYEDPLLGLALSLVGLDVGLLTGLLVTALDAQPSTERTLYLDLGFIGGGALGAAIPFLVYQADDYRDLEMWPFGLGVLVGSVGGWLLTYFLTDSMDARPETEGALDVHLGIAPIEGGGMLQASFEL